MKFPIDMKSYKPLKFDIFQTYLEKPQKDQLQTNISLVRDAIVFMTAYSNAKGLGGHTGGAYDLVPESEIIKGFANGESCPIFGFNASGKTCGNHNDTSISPILYDEAGHRVALQYVNAALDDNVAGMNLEDLLNYREFKSGLPGHPEYDPEHGIFFSSGRLGHLWSYVNGIAERNPDQKIIMLGSDGSQMEGNNAEAARYAVKQNLNILLLIDDNNITIAGHPSDYMPGFDVSQTLNGHGINTHIVDAENIDKNFYIIKNALKADNPVAIINQRKMAPGIEEIEDTPKAHDAINKEIAIKYLAKKGYQDAVEILNNINKPNKSTISLYGSSKEKGSNRSEFGGAVCEILKKMSPDDIKKNIIIGSDLDGSCGLKQIGENFPEIYRIAGPMEANNFSVAAGFGSESGYQGIIGTFSAFLEMLISQETMARLNKSNVLAHFSHAGVDGIADNTCHFGINIFFADNGLPEGDNTKLYFPADASQMEAVVKRVFHDPGLRFIFSTRTSTPYILDKEGNYYFDTKKDYRFIPGKDEIIREGDDGLIISYGDMLHRCLDVVDHMSQNDNIEIGLINKPTLNTDDYSTIEEASRAPFVLVVENQNIKTGLGSKFETLLSKYSKFYDHMGVNKPGIGGLDEQISYQGLDRNSIEKKVRSMLD